jgi:CheY-like chemotaxis protein
VRRLSTAEIGAEVALQSPVDNGSALRSSNGQEPASKPQRDRSTSSLAERSVSDERKLRGVPILIVEDDVSSARVVSAILANQGAEVRVVRTGEEALALIRAFHARIVVIDLVLPGMSGLLFTRQLKSQPSTRDVAVVAVSALDSPEVARMTASAGCAAYLPKPIDVQTFPSIVARLLTQQ